MTQGYTNVAGGTAYVAPETLSEVLGLLREHGDEAKVLAGGQSLLVMLREGYLAPELLVSLRNVPELRAQSDLENGGRRIGAMARQADLERSRDLWENYTALSEAVAAIATVQVRNQGTLGGNLCHADPTADPPAALIALGATLEIVGSEGARTIPVEEFFQSFLEVNLVEGEILSAILLPPTAPRSESAYIKHRLRRVDTAIVGAAAWVQVDENRTTTLDVRIGLSAAGTTPIRAREAEDVLRGAVVSASAIGEAGKAAAAACDPLDDTESSAWYRRRMVEVVVQRALTRSLERAGALPSGAANRSLEGT